MKRTITDINPLWARRGILIFFGLPATIFLMVATALCCGCSCARQLVKTFKAEGEVKS